MYKAKLLSRCATNANGGKISMRKQVHVKKTAKNYT